MEAKILEALIRQGPMTVKRISRTFKLPKSQVRGILWYSKKTCLTWRAPFSVRKKPIWSYSETPVRPQVVHAKKVLEPTDP